MYYTCIQPSAEYRVNTLYSDPWQPKSGFNGFRSRTGSRNLPWCWGGGEACTPARRMADELRRVVTQHTGADFEAGRVGHRNGPQIAGTEHEEREPEQRFHIGYSDFCCATVCIRIVFIVFTVFNTI